MEENIRYNIKIDKWCKTKSNSCSHNVIWSHQGAVIKKENTDGWEITQIIKKNYNSMDLLGWEITHFAKRYSNDLYLLEQKEEEEENYPSEEEEEYLNHYDYNDDDYF